MMMVVDILSWILLIAGGLFSVIGGIGILRLPDLYSRTHGASITDTLGAPLMLSGLALQTIPYMVEAYQAGGMAEMLGGASWMPIAKLFVIGIFLFLTSPTSGHALVKAAYASGVRWDDDKGEAVIEDEEEAK